MRQSLSVLIVAALACGCSAGTTTEPSTSGASSASGSDVTTSGGGRLTALSLEQLITGGGYHIVTVGGVEYNRNFGFTARRRPDGSVDGRFEFTPRNLGISTQGHVTCFSIVGNAAWLGGVVDHVVGTPPNPAIAPGSRVAWRLVDNGEGADAVDLISGGLLRTPPSTPDELAYCATHPALPPLSPLAGGNIQIH